MIFRSLCCSTLFGLLLGGSALCQTSSTPADQSTHAASLSSPPSAPVPKTDGQPEKSKPPTALIRAGSAWPCCGRKCGSPCCGKPDSHGRCRGNACCSSRRHSRAARSRARLGADLVGRTDRFQRPRGRLLFLQRESPRVAVQSTVQLRCEGQPIQLEHGQTQHVTHCRSGRLSSRLGFR